jgi:hypothetical protein
MAELHEIGHRYPKIGPVWTKCITPEGEKEAMYTTTEYPPSALDDP